MRIIRTLCSGGELFGVGARAAGWAHVDGYEIDSSISAVARLNGFAVHTADVCAVDYEHLPPVDHLHASPSCKSASQANRSGGETEADRAVADAICRAIRAHQGRTVSLENVWGYRTFESFWRILHVLHDCGFVADYEHVNAADFGVSQTRKRLILRAVRGRRVPPLIPTHCRGGDMFHAPWVGWLSAIADILHTLPPSEFAPWQLDRLPKELRETALFHSGQSEDRHGNDYQQQSRGVDELAYTVSTMSPGWYKAFLVPGQNADQEWGRGYLENDDPAMTVSAYGNPGQHPRAFIVGGGNTQRTQVDSKARWGDEPMFTVTASDGASKVARAFLVGGQYARNNDDPDRRVQTAVQDDPSWTITPGSAKDTRAWLSPGRVVKLTVQALGRFQTVPDGYRGLTSVINGNGVPCLLARRIMESFHG